MKVIYRNQVKATGSSVDEFKGSGMFIIFGDNAPEELRDYCYSVNINPINGELKAGQFLIIDDQAYEITCVGPEAPVTLAGLGHMTVSFTGLTEPEMMGTMYVKLAPGQTEPDMGIGTMFLVVEP